jgi:hypothetical protein
MAAVCNLASKAGGRTDVLEAFSLKRVYVPLRAYYNRKVEGQKCEELEARLAGSKQCERVVVDLEKELETWLTKAKKDDAIRLISGGPGSGKSSFAKMFSAKLAAKGTISVLFIPLHHFDPSDDLINAVGKFVQMDGILPHNPLAAEHRESRLLIIFDGLDELAMQGKIAEKTAQDFVREVQRKVERFNQGETCLQVLIGVENWWCRQMKPTFARMDKSYTSCPTSCLKMTGRIMWMLKSYWNKTSGSFGGKAMVQ